MATNFAGLTTKQKLVWSRDVWSAARDKMFIKKFVGTDENSMIQRVTELTKTEKGEQMIMFLVADLVGDGVVGDNEREGMEEDMQSYEQIIAIDLTSRNRDGQFKSRPQLAGARTIYSQQYFGPEFVEASPAGDDRYALSFAGNQNQGLVFTGTTTADSAGTVTDRPRDAFVVASAVPSGHSPSNARFAE